MDDLIKVVQAAQTADKSAQESLYREYSKAVYYLALKLLKHPEDAEDMTQEVFITAFQKLPTLKEPQTFPAWLNRITANKCTNFLTRSRKFVTESFDESDETEFIEETDPQLLPDEALDKAATVEIITSIVDELPLELRVCVYYYYYEMLSIAEIAEQLALSEAGVKKRLATARRIIREAIEKREEKDGIKLYVGVPFLIGPFLRNAMENIEVPAEVLTGIYSNITTSLSVSASAAGTATTASASVISAKTIITAAVACVVVTCGIIAGVVMFGGNGGDEPDEPVTNIDLSGQGITDEQLAEMVSDSTIPQSVIYLNLSGNQITDASPLAELENLRYLNLDNNQISDTSSLYGLDNLLSLGLSENQITDISSLGSFDNLMYLWLGNNQLSDISPLNGLVGLQYLRLENNQLTDISPLSGLVNLEFLMLFHNQISDISPLSGLVSLQYLHLDNNPITDISPLSGLVNLLSLGMSVVQVTDISPLSELVNLQNLYIWNNQITDWSPVAHVENIEGKE
jgi:RNA polymerase sigma factor (sigma-70 family)